MKNIIITLFVSSLFLFSCKKETKDTATIEQSTPPFNTEEFTLNIESAHNKKKVFEYDVIKFNILLEFGGKEKLFATVIMAPNLEYGILIKDDGSEIIINKDKIYCSPSLKDNDKVRFDARTWAYFLLFPYKLNDPGTQWDYFDDTPENYYTGKLSFKPQTGDSPDDWYGVYTSKKTNLIHHVAYINTTDKSKEEAELDPHAIEYQDYKEINGVPIAHQWTFWEWRNNSLTKKLGTARISDVEFISEMKNNFNPPVTFIEK